MTAAAGPCDNDDKAAGGKDCNGTPAGDSSEVAGNNSGKDATGTAATTTTARTMVGTDGKDHKAAYSNDS